MNLIPSQWVVIATQAVNIIIAGLGVVDLNYHTQLLDNPLTLTIMGILSILGIHQTINPTIKK
jgi:hypothetical protein